ncbi:replication-relaxation family protein [Paenibacillus polymyxa]|uniref:replication-relaxation family protein n=1 Tax=Paenibacillus polymyxa TaxID=1406 RepID=UPI0025B6C66F|nr:replication-relaxation family protein [Paenibacillus polymyxa]MDN4106204.1 replication-relaxation family protein [Paenibacillus polymyxa]
MSQELLKFEDEFSGGTLESAERSTSLILTPPMAKENPYIDSLCPNDIMDYLLPNGELFGLFSDPYATMFYHKPAEGIRNGRFWLEERIEDGTFTEREIRLLDFLSNVRIATRSQIRRAVFKESDEDRVVVDFLKKCRRTGVLCAFSWVTPLKDQRKKPLVYALTRIGADAAEIILKRKFTDDFWFQPIEIPAGRGPEMTPLFQDLVSAEIHCELTRIDRLISWQRNPLVRLKNGQIHHPTSTFQVIKDAGEMRTFWVETVRIGKDWVSKVKNRFQKTQNAIQYVNEFQKPARVIVVADGDSRIPYLAELAREFMPSVEVRFTTDERLLQGLGKQTFVIWDNTGKCLKAQSIGFLQPNSEGMTASEYLASQMMVPDDDEFEE